MCSVEVIRLGTVEVVGHHVEILEPHVAGGRNGNFVSRLDYITLHCIKLVKSSCACQEYRGNRGPTPLALNLDTSWT
jgi:hypothetical protein